MIYLTLLAVLCCSLTSSTPLNSRIINGTDAPNTPWAAFINTYLENGYGSLCTGSLVAPDWILTARHCVTSDNAKVVTITVNIGDVNRYEGQEIEVSKFFLHSAERFNIDDIALLKLQREVVGITPVKVQYDTNVNYDGKVATIYGWGYTIPSHEGTASTLLQTTKVVVNNNLDYLCGSAFICFNPRETGSNACHGDSGGPMVIEENNEVVLIGVTKGGTDRNCIRGPTAYVSTSYYGDWIQNTINSEL